VPDEPREVNPFSLDKNRKSTAPPNEERKEEPDPDEARELTPLMFTKPGEDYYTSDDPMAQPAFADFSPAIYPADADVEVPGEVAMEDEEVALAPKGSSAPASVSSSPPSPMPTPATPATTAPAESTEPAMEEAAKSIQDLEPLEDADKDSGQPKESESSTPTSSSTPTPSDGSSEPPA
jgi:hypothetical protein